MDFDSWLDKEVKAFKDQPEKKHKRKAEFSEKTDKWLDENVNQPLAKKGLGGLGAGISAAGSTLASLFDTDENVAPMSVGKGPQFFRKTIKKKYSDLKKPERVLDYSKMLDKGHGYGSKAKYKRDEITGQQKHGDPEFELIDE